MMAVAAPVIGRLARLARRAPSPAATVDTPAPEGPGIGRFDRREGDRLMGWAWRPEAPEETVIVEQWVDGLLAAETRAELVRPDLVDAGVGHGRYGWAMALKLDPTKGEPQRVELRVRGAGPLPDGRLELTYAAVQADAAAVVRASDAVGLEDMIQGGWFNDASGEAAPGFPVSADDVVVDVGSGDGGLATFCARRAQRTVLVDVDAERMERAVEAVRRNGGREVSGHAGDAARLPFPDGFASRVICTEVLEHVDDPAAVMAELFRIGRPGALYLLSVPNAVAERLQQDIAWSIYFEKPNHIRIFDPDAFTRLVEDAGLVIERRCPHGFFWTLYWMFFWKSGVDLGASHPLLDAWTRTWQLALASPDGPQIRAKLDALAAHSNALVARKPEPSAG